MKPSEAFWIMCDIESMRPIGARKHCDKYPNCRACELDFIDRYCIIPNEKLEELKARCNVSDKEKAQKS